MADWTISIPSIRKKYIKRSINKKKNKGKEIRKFPSLLKQKQQKNFSLFCPSHCSENFLLHLSMCVFFLGGEVIHFSAYIGSSSQLSPFLPCNSGSCFVGIFLLPPNVSFHLFSIFLIGVVSSSSKKTHPLVFSSLFPFQLLSWIAIAPILFYWPQLVQLGWRSSNWKGNANQTFLESIVNTHTLTLK